MRTSAETATIIAEATGLHPEVVQNRLRLLREAGLIRPTGRGRYATPLNLEEAARTLIACLASDPASESAATVAAVVGLHRRRVVTTPRREGPLTEAFLTKQAIPARDHDVGAALAWIMERLASGTMFPRPEAEDFRGDREVYKVRDEHFSIAVRSVFTEGGFLPVSAGMDYGVHGLYDVSVSWSGDPKHGGGGKPGTRHRAGRERRDSFGLQVIERVAVRFNEAVVD